MVMSRVDQREIEYKEKMLVFLSNIDNVTNLVNKIFDDDYYKKNNIDTSVAKLVISPENVHFGYVLGDGGSIAVDCVIQLHYEFCEPREIETRDPGYSPRYNKYYRIAGSYYDRELRISMYALNGDTTRTYPYYDAERFADVKTKTRLKEFFQYAHVHYVMVEFIYSISEYLGAIKKVKLHQSKLRKSIPDFSFFSNTHPVILTSYSVNTLDKNKIQIMNREGIMVTSEQDLEFDKIMREQKARNNGEKSN